MRNSHPTFRWVLLLALLGAFGPALGARPVVAGVLHQSGNTPPVAGFGNALDFDGTNDYVEVPYAAALNPDSFTVEGWVYSRQSSNYSAPFSSRDSSATGNTRGWNVYNTSGGKWEYWFGSGGSGWVTFQGPPVQLDTWTHIAATYDSSARTARFYVDGVLQQSRTNTDQYKNTAQPFRIGASDNIIGGVYQAAWFFDGYVDEVRVWNTARDAQQIADYRFRYIADPTTEPGLVAYWAFNQDSGTTLTDLTGTHSGTLRNMADADWRASASPPALPATEGQPVSGYLKASDDDGDLLTYTITDQPDHGTISDLDDSTGSFTYTPDPQWCGTDSLTYKVNDGTTDSNEATASFAIACVDDTGLTVNNSAALGYTENDAPIVVAPNLALDLGPGQVVEAARVEIGAGYQSGADILGIEGQTGTSGTTANGLSWTWSAATGVLSLSGTGDWAKYQEALRQVTYVNTSDDLTNDQRTVRFSLGNGLEYAGNGHFYEFVSATGINWNAAKTAAEAKSYFGKQGYLATVTSAGENGFIATKLSGEGWMGANDAATEGDWRWVTGPEAGQQFWQGGPASSGGQPVSGRYSNWASTEPNNAGNEDYGHFLPSAQWNDYRSDNGNIRGYVVEYGGLSTDADIPLAGSAQINVTPINDPPTNLVLSSTSVDENQPAGTVVGTFDQDDPDGGPTFTYQLGTAPGCDGSDSATFAIDGDQLKTNFVFDYETKSSYQICVRVRDGRGGEAIQPFTITVGNQDIAPTFGVQPPPLNGLYGRPYSPYPFFLSAADPEPTFSLYSGTLPPGLTLSPSGVLSGTPTQAGDFIFTVEADNGVSPNAYKQSVHITIEKRPLLVQIDDQFKTQGNPNPPLTYVIGGFAPGDDESVLDVKPTPVTTATVSSPVGLYLIELGDPQPSDDNYDILPAINGVLAITLKEVPTLDWSVPAPITYGTALTTAVQLDATAVGTDSLPLAGTFVYNPPAGTVLDVGIGRTLKVTFTPDDTEYIAVSLSRSIDVLPASLTITAEDKTIAAGDPLPLLTAAYSGFVAGDVPGDLDSPVQLSTDADPDRAGTYPIRALGARDANYDIGFVDGTLTVTVSADNGGVNVGAPGSHFPYTGAGYAPGETVTVTVTGPGGSPVVTTTATADVNGLVQAGVYLDPDAPEGPHQVEIRGPSGTVTGTVTVDAGAPVATPQDPDLVVNGRPAAPGSEVPYVARGFVPGEEVTIQVNGRNVGTTTANPDGDIEVKLVFDPNTPPGGYEVVGIGGNNARQASVTIDPGADKQRAPGDAPKINTAPVKPDGYLPFEAGGFTPGQQVPILVDGQVVGTATADISGTVKTYVHLGPQTPEGPHTIEAGPGGPQEQVTTSAADGDPRPNPGGIPVLSNANPTGAPGGYFPFTGTGYQPGEKVTIEVNGVVVGTVTADENGAFSTVIQPDPNKTSETLILNASAPSGAATQAQATIDPDAPELYRPDGVPVLRDTGTIFLPIIARGG